ncbi:MAG: hypothetical protein ACKESC_01945, partial [Candidatus Hodgkinia cicadicola]
GEVYCYKDLIKLSIFSLLFNKTINLKICYRSNRCCSNNYNIIKFLYAYASNPLVLIRDSGNIIGRSKFLNVIKSVLQQDNLWKVNTKNLLTDTSKYNSSRKDNAFSALMQLERAIAIALN